MAIMAPTFMRNNARTPIDGIWLSKGLLSTFSGYLDYDSIKPGAEHRCLWTDITFNQAFGHNIPPFVRPPMRRLHCKDPRIVENYVKKNKTLALQHELPKWIFHIFGAAKAPLSPALIQEYEAIDNLRCCITAEAERHCRILRMGQVEFSPELQLANRKIMCYKLFLKTSQDSRVSSRLLARTLKKSLFGQACISVRQCIPDPVTA
jgi:hypothetical protein